MKKKLSPVIGCLITLVLIVLSIWRLGFLFRPFETDMAQNAIEDFHRLPENSVEVIGYGSSHIWRGLNTMEMYRNYGIGAYNYGCHWQHINTTSIFLKDSLRTQSPKVVLIETYRAHDPLVDTDMDGEIYYTRHIHGLDAKKDYLKQCFGEDRERYLSYYIPFAAFHSNWPNLEGWSFRDGTKDNDYLKTMGYLPTTGVHPVTINDPATFEQWDFGPEAVLVLQDIVKTCREAGAEILFYTAPWQADYHYGDAMARFAERNGCAYLNLFEHMEEMGLDCATDFSDLAHLNASGSAKVANYLGAYIAEHYDVTDLRTVPGNLWEQQCND